MSKGRPQDIRRTSITTFHVWRNSISRVRVFRRSMVIRYFREEVELMGMFVLWAALTALWLAIDIAFSIRIHS